MYCVKNSDDLAALLNELRQRHCRLSDVEISADQDPPEGRGRRGIAGYGPRLGKALLTKNGHNTTIKVLSLNVDRLLAGNAKTIDPLAPLLSYLQGSGNQPRAVTLVRACAGAAPTSASTSTGLHKLVLQSDECGCHPLRVAMVDAMIKAASTNSNITTLAFPDWSMAFSNAVLAHALQTTTSITDLVLNLHIWREDGADSKEQVQAHDIEFKQTVLKALKTNTTLQHVTLIALINMKVTVPLLDALSRRRASLQALTLQLEGVTTRDFQALSKLLGRSASLHTLNLKALTIQAKDQDQVGKTGAGRKKPVVDLTPQRLLSAVRRSASVRRITFQDTGENDALWLHRWPGQTDPLWLKHWPAIQERNAKLPALVQTLRARKEETSAGAAVTTLSSNGAVDNGNVPPSHMPPTIDLKQVPALLVGALPSPRLSRHAFLSGLLLADQDAIGATAVGPATSSSLSTKRTANNTIVLGDNSNLTDKDTVVHQDKKSCPPS